MKSESILADLRRALRRSDRRKRRLPRSLLLAAIVVGGGAVLRLSGVVPSTPGLRAAEPPTADQGPPEAAENNQADAPHPLAEAVRRLEQHPRLEMRLRWRTEGDGPPVVGIGAYYHSLRDRRLRTRLEVRLQSGSRSAQLLRIGDGSTVWTRRTTAEGAVVERREPRTAERGAISLPHGGLGELLRALDERFVFAPPVAARMHDEPVWLLRGAARSPEEASASPWMPDELRVVLAREGPTELLPLRIEYRRKAPDAPDSRLLAALDLVPVASPEPLDDLLFRIDAGSEAEADSTSADASPSAPRRAAAPPLESRSPPR